MTSRIPDKATVDGLEDRWNDAWAADGVYRFDRTKTRDEIYSIDTPPPTVSGSLHVGHVLSLIHISEPTRLRRISYAVFCLKKKKKNTNKRTTIQNKQQNKKEYNKKTKI